MAIGVRSILTGNVRRDLARVHQYPFLSSKIRPQLAQVSGNRTESRRRGSSRSVVLIARRAQFGLLDEHHTDTVQMFFSAGRAVNHGGSQTQWTRVRRVTGGLNHDS